MQEINDAAELQEGAQAARKYLKYDDDFKHKVVTIYKSGVYDNALACASAYGISDKTLYNWIKKFTVTPHVVSIQTDEISKLKKELARSRMENEILKKAAIYFASQA